MQARARRSQDDKARHSSKVDPCRSKDAPPATPALQRALAPFCQGAIPRHARPKPGLGVLARLPRVPPSCGCYAPLVDLVDGIGDEGLHSGGHVLVSLDVCLYIVLKALEALVAVLRQLAQLLCRRAGGRGAGAQQVGWWGNLPSVLRQPSGAGWLPSPSGNPWRSTGLLDTRVQKMSAEQGGSGKP